MNAYGTPKLRTFKLYTLQKCLQLKHNIVIAMSSKHLTIGETQDDALFSLSSLLYLKGIPSLIHL